MAVKKLILDIMLHDRFVCTLRMPVTFDMIEDYDEMGGVIINLDKVQEYVENKRPSLIGKDYRICL